MRHPIDKIKILLETDYIKNRLSTTGDRDLRALAESKSFQQAAMKARNWRDRLMILTRLGDVGAIMAGGWPIYKKTYDQAIADGKSISEAKKPQNLSLHLYPTDLSNQVRFKIYLGFKLEDRSQIVYDVHDFSNSIYKNYSVCY